MGEVDNEVMTEQPAGIVTFEWLCLAIISVCTMVLTELNLASSHYCPAII